MNKKLVAGTVLFLVNAMPVMAMDHVQEDAQPRESIDITEEQGSDQSKKENVVTEFFRKLLQRYYPSSSAGKTSP